MHFGLRSSHKRCATGLSIAKKLSAQTSGWGEAALQPAIELNHRNFQFGWLSTLSLRVAANVCTTIQQFYWFVASYLQLVSQTAQNLTFERA